MTTTSSSPPPASTRGPATTLARDADSLLTGLGPMTIIRDEATGFVTSTLVGVVQTHSTYDDYGALATSTATINGAPVLHTAYSRDLTDRINGKVETIEGQTTTYDYSYDLRARLTAVMVDGQVTHLYEYDANGNRTRFEDLPGNHTVHATFDAQDRLLTYGATTYDWTPNGDLLSRTDSTTGQTTTYDYDVHGQLRALVLPDATTIDYIIDPDDRRIAREVDGTLDRAWLYDGPLNVVAELDAQGTTTARFAYATLAHSPDLMWRGAQTYRILSDHLGSPRLVIDTTTGAIVQRMDYDACGRVESDTNPGFQPFGFAGGLYDVATGLVRFGARDYDPEVGRWTAKDPIRFAGGDSNLYGYVLGDPVNWVDPEGLATIPIPAPPIVWPLAGPLICVGIVVGGLWAADKIRAKPRATPRARDDGDDDDGDDDNCDAMYTKCLGTPLTRRYVDNWGVSICMACRGRCVAEGSWPSRTYYPHRSCRF